MLTTWCDSLAPSDEIGLSDSVSTRGSVEHLQVVVPQLTGHR